MWSVNSPETVVEYDTSLPAGQQREMAFTDALRNWAASNPVAAAGWINDAEPSHQDTGIPMESITVC